MTHKFKRGQVVFYNAPNKRAVRAVVRCTHRDETVTVEPNAVLSLSAFGSFETRIPHRRFRMANKQLRKEL